MNRTIIHSNSNRAAADWDDQLKRMESALENVATPSVNLVHQNFRTPWSVLVSTLISARTRDSATLTASKRLLEQAASPEALLALEINQTERLIYPVGFYKTKARNLHKISQILIDKYNSQVPPESESIISLPGVGKKTANLVLGIGFGIPAICVDVHVHRIANRIGWINTNSPDLSEIALKEILPLKWRIPLNRIMVSFGQTICTPLSPFCSKCPMTTICMKNNVRKSR